MTSPTEDTDPPAPTLVVLPGRPGTGKTTIAREVSRRVGACYLRVDAAETALARTGAGVGVGGYAVVHELAVSNLLLGSTVVVDAVNPVPEARASWRDAAERARAQLVHVETVLLDADEHRRRVETRRADIPGHVVPTWEEVEGGEWAVWDEERDGSRLRVDSSDTAAAVARVLDAIRGTSGWSRPVPASSSASPQPRSAQDPTVGGPCWNGFMTTTTMAPSGGRDAQSRSRLLDRAVAAMSARRRADVELLETVLVFAHGHVVADAERVAGWRSDTVHAPGSVAALFGEQAVPIAGPGAPLVAEFAPMELAAALDLSHEAALALLGDVLDLAHRLPRLWALVRDLRVPVHLARRAAQESRDLSADAADHADRLLVWQPRRLNPHRVGVLVHEARLYADPDRAVADHDAALETRKVDLRLGEGAPGTGEVFMVLDEADALAFDRTVTTMAATAGVLGHPGSLDVRRAHAAGLLADPQRALDLLAVADADPDRLDEDPRTCPAEEAAHAPATPFGRGSGGAVIVLHVTDRDLLTGPLPGRDGVARSARLGPVLMERLAGWLVAAGNVTVKPVLDVTTIPAVDQHDPPPRMAEAVRLRDETCVYPRCGRPSSACDLDHIDAYVPLDEGGPPGQTRPDNLAPLCRRHHRAKTFGDFTYRRRSDGSYEWALPTGITVTTDPPHRRP